MSLLTPQEIKELEQKKTVQQMLNYISEKFNLDFDPGVITKAVFLSGLKSALNILKPKRK